MGKKKNPPTTGAAGRPALKIGTRVRCSDDGVAGRIAWANALSVKVQWDDGEEVTWKRAELAVKPIECLDAEQTEHAEQPAVEAAPAEAPATEATLAEPAAPEQPIAAATPGVEEQASAPASVEQPAALEMPAAPESEATPTEAAAGEAPTPAPETQGGEPLHTELPGGFAINKRDRKAKAPAEPKVQKRSALDAAAQVLAETGTPMTCKELIGTMGVKGYWTSPGGQTPEATLHAAMLREIALKGERTRFVEAAPGRFALRPTV